MIEFINIEKDEVEVAIQILESGQARVAVVRGNTEGVLEKIESLGFPVLSKIGGNGIFINFGGKRLLAKKGFDYIAIYFIEGGWKNVYKSANDFIKLKEVEILQILEDFTLEEKLSLLANAGYNREWELVEILKKTIMEGIGQ